MGNFPVVCGVGLGLAAAASEVGQLHVSCSVGLGLAVDLEKIKVMKVSLSVGLGLAARYPTYRSQAGLGLAAAVKLHRDFNNHKAEGNYRQENPAEDLYNVYRGLNQSPDFDAAPFQTSVSLPIVTAALAANNNHHFVTRKINEFGLESKNIEETIIRIDAGGDEVAANPSAPDNISVVPAAANTVRVRADYFYGPDGDDQAVSYLVYTKVGADPVVGVDAPEVVTMVKRDGNAHLDHTTTAFNDGDDVRVLVTTRRVDAGPTNFDSTNTTILTTVADEDGPGVPDITSIHFEDEAQQI